MKHFTVLSKIFSNNSFSSKGIRRNLIQVFSILLLALIGLANLQAQVPRDTIKWDLRTASRIIPGTGNNNDYIITSGGVVTANTLTIESGYEGSIILKDLRITRAGQNSTTSSCITVKGRYFGTTMSEESKKSNMNPLTKVNFILEDSVKLILAPNNVSGSSTLHNSSEYCALQVDRGAQIHISAIEPENNASGILIAKSTAKEPGGDGNNTNAYSYGNAGAAIGSKNVSYNVNSGQGMVEIYQKNTNGTAIKYSDRSASGGNIIISSGTITAWGGHGAGIGGGWYTYYDGIILIYGGEVEARSARHSAGMGSGCPDGGGVIQNRHADNSMILVLPPAKIEAYGADQIFEKNPNLNAELAKLALSGAQTIAYMNDPNKPLITVHTVDSLKQADIYLDLSETIVKDSTTLADIFNTLHIKYDLNKVKVGRTDDLMGLFSFRGLFEQSTTFFTDGSSLKPATLGRPYMPVVDVVTGNVNTKKTIILPLLETEISFKDYKSKPLEMGYSAQQAKENAYVVKMVYSDPVPMTNVTYKLQEKTHFSSIIFLASDSATVVSTPPATLNRGDVYYMVLPINTGKPVGIYSDVLMITGKWKDINIPGYIRRIGEQRVVFDDSGSNNHIVVDAIPRDFVETYPTNRNVIMSLNINHTGTNVVYNPSDVTAKYIVTKDPNYDAVVAMNPISTWTDLNIPNTSNQNMATIVPFNDKVHGVYFIHWYVESGIVYAHNQYAFGPYIITEPIKTGYLIGNPFVCADQIPSEIKGEISSGGSENFTYQWQMSIDNGLNWTNVGGDSPNYTPDILTVSPTYFQRITIDNEYGGHYYTSIFSIEIANDGQDFYWSRNAGNNNWNDPNNWVNASGGRLLMVPLTCSNVHIPSGATIYPSLHPNNTPTYEYGLPVCGNIIFEYGAELAYQHKLTYDKAYVQYNWGYYDNFNGIGYGNQPGASASNSGSVNKRDRWYALAAPLKSMATGDFSFAGYPLAWQAGFALSDPKTGTIGNEIEVGSFDKQFVTNDKPLSETNNAIAVKVALYENALGYTNHLNLEALKGIIEIPYFESEGKKAYYPAHSYDRFTKESKFYYFNPATLQILHSPIGSMKRSNEAYRFVYEEDGIAPNIQIVGTPSTVAGYKQTVKKQNATSLKVMIGNPFMTSINAKQFFDVNNADINNSKINKNAGYQLFNSADQTWRHYEFERGGRIPPLQAFIITLVKDEVELLFPLEGTYALAGPTTPIAPALESRLYLKTTNNKGLESDYSVLVATKADEERANVKKMIYKDGDATPEAFFIASDNKSYNLIQNYETGMDEIGIAVKSSDTKNLLSLTFDKIAEFYAMSDLYPVLFDKYLGVKQSLTLNNKYDFNQRQTSAENKYIDADRFVLRLMSSTTGLSDEKEGENISIMYQDGQVEVRASRNIKKVEIYDALGRQIHSATDIDKKHYTKSMPLIQDIYIVKVYTENGGIKVDKIMTLK